MGPSLNQRFELELTERIDRLERELRSIRRHLHQRPELSGAEFRTTEYLAGLLKQEGVPYRIPESKRGLIAGPNSLDSQGVIAIRADLDALPIQDTKEDVLYRSRSDGLMHACGHDAHATIVLGTTLALHHCTTALQHPIPWRAIFQPAEETAAGALEMIQAGAMEGVDAVIGLHVDPDRPVGDVGERSGVLTADCFEFSIRIHGKGGHAARPHQAIDPIAAAAQLITFAYQAVPRSLDAQEPLVLTFGAIHGGEGSNVIPDQVELRGTIRSFHQSSRERAIASLKLVARGVATTTGTEIELVPIRSVDAVINDPKVNQLLREAARSVLGSEHVRSIEKPSLGGEDFSAYRRHAPGAMIRLGVASHSHWPRLHSPRFDIDERALAIGAKVLGIAVLRFADRGIDDAASTT